jgi:hypothetical protein
MQNPTQPQQATATAVSTRVDMLVDHAPRLSSVSYSYEDALRHGAFKQRDLVTHKKFADLADKRGVQHLNRERLEALDELGVLKPIGFASDTEPFGVALRPEGEFLPWDEFARDDRWGTKVVDAFYSPWQLLYVREAVEGRYANFDLGALLDEGELRAPEAGSDWRRILERRRDDWLGLDAAWRPTILLLIRVQNRYFPSVRGTVTLDPGASDAAFRQEVAAFDPPAVIASLGVTTDDVKRAYEHLSFWGTGLDPVKTWYPIFRTISYREQDKFKDVARRAHDLYDGAAVLRRLYRDATGELLPDSDEVHSWPQDWRQKWLGHERRMTYDGQDMKRLLELRGAYPNRVHVLVEGETEEAVLRTLLRAFRDEPESLGVRIETFSGVGNLTSRLLRSGAYAREAVLVADHEGDVARTVKALRDHGELENMHLRLCDKNFEEDNLSVAELVRVARELGRAKGVRVSLTTKELRDRHERQVRARGRHAPGLGSVIVQMLRAPKHGSLSISKVELGGAIADLLLNGLEKAQDKDAFMEQRPIVKLAVDIARVTGR